MNELCLHSLRSLLTTTSELAALEGSHHMKALFSTNINIDNFGSNTLVCIVTPTPLWSTFSHPRDIILHCFFTALPVLFTDPSHSHTLFIHRLIGIPPPVLKKKILPSHSIDLPTLYHINSIVRVRFWFWFKSCFGSLPVSQPQTTQAAPKRTKWSNLSDPSLKLKYGSKERALDLSLELSYI